MNKKIAIVGAGPGGTAAAMILAHRGYDVQVFEKNPTVGGRNAELQVGDFSFDTGPTFLHTPWLIQQIFDAAGEKVDDHLDLVQIDPFNKIVFQDATIHCYTDPDKMYDEIKKVFPGNEKNYHQYLKDEKKLNEALFPCLLASYGKWWNMLRPKLLQAAPHVFNRDSVYSKLGKYFSDEHLQLVMSFQTKYLGMTPWKCPGFLSILASWEYLYGVYHIQGGLCKLSQAMAKIAENKGAKIHLNAPIKEVLHSGKNITGIELESGEKVDFDAVVMNADFAYGMTHLFGEKNIPKAKMQKVPMSCSTFMLYLGLDTVYEDEAHHQILMADDPKAWTNTIDRNDKIPEDMSIYVRNSCVTDPTVAPEGKSGLYVLVPVPNNLHKCDWSTYASEYREKVLDRVIAQTGMKDLRDHVEIERMITPDDWEGKQNVFLGATFSLKHTLNQMLYFRPHNHYRKFGNLFLTGGGTHPGSGVIPIIQSALISSNLIDQQLS